MRRNSKYIISGLLVTGGVSCLYFLCLLLHAPFLIVIIITAVFLYALYRLFLHQQDIAAFNSRLSLPVIIIFALCMYMTTRAAYLLSTKHGGWDAWAIWNLHARYLADPHYWKNMFLNTETEHPDYPLCQPAFLAFLFRLASNHYFLTIAFLFSLVITISIPMLIFSELLEKNIVIALFTFFLLSQDNFFIVSGVSEYADTLVSLFFLAAFVGINYVQNNKKYIAVCSFLLVCCVWTKNEGAILAIIFFLFYARTFFAFKNLKYTMLGAGLPTISLLLFKIICPIQNDMVSSINRQTLHRIFEIERYRMIYDTMIQNLNQKFYYVKIGIYINIIIGVLQKQAPGKQFFLISTCFMMYMGIYVVTPHNLVWHLNTSQDRLMLQLTPSLIYVISSKLAEIKFILEPTRGEN